MLNKQEQEILDNAPESATHYVIHSITGECLTYMEGGGELGGWCLTRSLADLRKKQGGQSSWLSDAVEKMAAIDKKQGKTVVDAVNTWAAEIPKLYVSELVNATSNYFVTFIDGQFGVDDVISNNVICDKEEFNQCVKEMSYDGGYDQFHCYKEASKMKLKPSDNNLGDKPAGYVKPRTKVEHVPMTTSHHYEIFKAMRDDGDVYVRCEDGEHEGMQGCIINLADAINDEVTIYRKVETEITWQDEAKELLIPASRRYMHNDGSGYSGYVGGYDCDDAVEIVANLIEKCHQQNN